MGRERKDSPLGGVLALVARVGRARRRRDDLVGARVWRLLAHSGGAGTFLEHFGCLNGIRLRPAKGDVDEEMGGRMNGGEYGRGRSAKWRPGPITSGLLTFCRRTVSVTVEESPTPPTTNNATPWPFPTYAVSWNGPVLSVPQLTIYSHLCILAHL